MKVVVLTTSYPRGPEDPAGRFVADAVEHIRARGVEVDVVSPASFRHFGIAFGHGIAGNLRARPWLALLVPAFLWNFRRAAKRSARGADLVHAHWLAAGAVAATLRRPYVVQVWGTDVALARRVPWLARPVLRRARLVLAASNALADEARALGAREVRVVPSGVSIPTDVGAPEEPPHVLYVGRLSAEKGVLELVEACRDLPLVVVGDGSLRARVPQAVGFVAPGELGPWYERAAVVAAPSRREGYGVAVREAMAWGRPVVATAVGGLLDAVEDGVTGLLVPPGDVTALRAALERLLGDAELRARLGAAAREKARRELSFTAATDALIGAYRSAEKPPDYAPPMSLRGRTTGEILGYYEGLVESDPGSVGYSEASLKRVLVDVVSTLPGNRVVDLGCGPNPVVAIELARRGRDVTGVELSRDFVENARSEAARRGASLRVEHASVHETPFPADAFDVAILSEVLEHIPDELEEPTLVEACRILRHGGRLVISVPNANSAFHRWQRLRTGVGEEHPQHLREYVPARLRGLVERAGFVIERPLRVPATVEPFRAGRSAWLVDRLVPVASLSLKAAFVARKP